MGGLIASMVAGAVSGGSKAKLSQMREEAKQMRAESLARLRGDENRQTVELQGSIVDARQEDSQDFLADQAKEQRTYDKGVLAQEITREDKIRADENAKGGNIAQKFRDLSAIYGEKKAKQMMAQTGDSGGLDASAQAKYKTESRKMAMEELGMNATGADIDKRADEIYSTLINSAKSNAPTIHPKERANLAKSMIEAGYIPKTDRAAQMAKLEAANYSQEDIADILSQADSMFSEKKEKKKTPTAIERRVQYQVEMGDTRDPSVIAAAMKKADKKEKKRTDRSKPLEDINSLPANVRRAIERQAKQVAEMENGKRSIEDIVKAILQERAKG